MVNGDEGLTWATWKEYLETHSDIGLFTIAYMHDSDISSCFCNWFCNLFTRILLWLVIFVQITIPVVLMLNNILEYDGMGFCPRGADNITRTLACAVGCIYFTKLSFLYGRKTSESKIALKDDVGCKNLLRAFLICDSVMNTIYEALVYLLNLWIVFLSSEPLNVVLNALALEFVLNLDDVIKKDCIAIYFNRTPTSMLTAYQNKFQIPHGGGHSLCKTGCWHCLFVPYILGLGFVVIYLPMCKP